MDSGKVKQYLKANQEIVEANITEFKKEISCLGDDPVLVAFGDEVYRILTAFLGDEYRITKVPHYSHYIGKEEYRKQILNKLKGYKVYKDQYENCVIENRKDHGTSEPE